MGRRHCTRRKKAVFMSSSQFFANLIATFSLSLLVVVNLWQNWEVSFGALNILESFSPLFLIYPCCENILVEKVSLIFSNSEFFSVECMLLKVETWCLQCLMLTMLTDLFHWHQTPRWPALGLKGKIHHTSVLQNCEKLNFCCLSHPVCGTLLWLP